MTDSEGSDAPSLLPHLYLEWDWDRLACSLFESDRDCIKILDVSGRMGFISEFGCCLMEIDDIGLLLGEPWSELWPEAARPVLRAALEHARTGAVARFSAACPTLKGTLKMWDVAISPITTKAGAIQGFLVVSRPQPSGPDAA